MLCYSDSGQPVDIPAGMIQQRLAVYGVLIEDDQILLLPHPANDWWLLPGGIAGPEEGRQAALQRFFRQSTNIAPVTGPLVLVEDRFWADDHGQGWLLTCFYFMVKRLATGISGLIDFENSAQPEWVNLDNLARQELLFGYDAIQAGLVHREVLSASD